MVITNRFEGNGNNMAFILGFSIPLVLLFAVIDFGIKKLRASTASRVLIALVFQSALTAGIAYNNAEIGNDSISVFGYVLIGATAALLSTLLILIRPTKAKITPPK